MVKSMPFSCPRCGYEFFKSSLKPTRRQQVIDVLVQTDKPLTPNEISEKSGIPIRTVYHVLFDLHDKGMLKSVAVLQGKRWKIGYHMAW